MKKMRFVALVSLVAVAIVTGVSHLLDGGGASVSGDSSRAPQQAVTCDDDELKITYREEDNDEVVVCKSPSSNSITVRAMKSSTVRFEVGSSLATDCNYRLKYRQYRRQYLSTRLEWEDLGGDYTCGSNNISVLVRGPEGSDINDGDPPHGTYGQVTRVLLRNDGRVWDCSGFTCFEHADFRITIWARQSRVGARITVGEPIYWEGQAKTMASWYDPDGDTLFNESFTQVGGCSGYSPSIAGNSYSFTYPTAAQMQSCSQGWFSFLVTVYDRNDLGRDGEAKTAFAVTRQLVNPVQTPVVVVTVVPATAVPATAVPQQRQSPQRQSPQRQSPRPPIPGPLLSLSRFPCRRQPRSQLD